MSGRSSKFEIGDWVKIKESEIDDDTVLKHTGAKDRKTKIIDKYQDGGGEWYYSISTDKRVGRLKRYNICSWHEHIFEIINNKITFNDNTP